MRARYHKVEFEESKRQCAAAGRDGSEVSITLATAFCDSRSGTYVERSQLPPTLGLGSAGPGGATGSGRKQSSPPCSLTLLNGDGTMRNR